MSIKKYLCYRMRLFFGGKFLKLIWGSLLFELIVLALLKPFINDFNFVGLVAVLIHISFSVIVLISYQNKNRFIILWGYIARNILMFWDLYAREIFILPNSGADTELYYSASVRISNDLSNLGNTSGGIFSDLMGILFRIIGDQRIIGQYINVLFGLSIIFIIYRILQVFECDSDIVTCILFITSFFPTSLIMSSIFLREIIPTFLVATSLLHFSKWVKKSKNLDAILSLILIGLASMFHSGVIGITLGYFFGFLFYSRSRNKLQFSFKTVISFFLLISVIIFGITFFKDALFGKFQNIDDIADIYNTANFRRGGSAYLTSITITNPFELIIYGPLKAFYFLTSPLPFDWRGGADIFTFLSDSILYLFTLIYFLKNRKGLGSRKTESIIIMCMLIGSSVIFGIGVGNAGTAVRHRQKLVPIFYVLIALIMDGKRRYSTTRTARNEIIS